MVNKVKYDKFMANRRLRKKGYRENDIDTDSFRNYISAGCVEDPSYTDNLDGTITINGFAVTLWDNTEGNPKDGSLTKYDLVGNTFTLVDGETNYIVGNYNSGNPILENTTDVTIINETTVIPIYTIFRDGIDLHIINWDKLGVSLINKIHARFVKTIRFGRERGLITTEFGTRNLNISEGVIWFGAVSTLLEEIDSTVDNLDLYFHNAGVWNKTPISQYNNTQYDDGTNLQLLSPNRYAINWIIRSIEDKKYVGVFLGRGDYKLDDAQAEGIPTDLPSGVTSNGILITKIIVKVGINTATSIQSAFDTVFSYSPVADHNSLINADGGTTEEKYHYRIADTFTDLTSGSIIGELAVVNDVNTLYRWTGTVWIAM